jgi:hypothetical protein
VVLVVAGVGVGADGCLSLFLKAIALAPLQTRATPRCFWSTRQCGVRQGLCS